MEGVLDKSGLDGALGIPAAPDSQRPPLGLPTLTPSPEGRRSLPLTLNPDNPLFNWTPVTSHYVDIRPAFLRRS